MADGAQWIQMRANSHVYRLGSRDLGKVEYQPHTQRWVAFCWGNAAVTVDSLKEGKAWVEVRAIEEELAR